MTSKELGNFARMIRRRRRGQNVAFRLNNRLTCFSFKTSSEAQRFAAKWQGRIV